MGSVVRSGLRLFAPLLLPALLAAAQLGFPAAARADPAGTAAKADLSKHPIYSTYRFSRDGSAVHFAHQPLAAPEGLVAEVMKRDAVLKKNLRAMGREVVFHPFLKGADIDFFIRRGDVDLATVGAVPTLLLAAGGDIHVTAITKMGSAALITKRKYRDIKDLKGRRIGYPDGSTAHLGLLTALSAAGMAEADVRMTPMEVAELPGALADGRIDAFSAFEPTPTGALAAHPDFVAIQRFHLSGYLLQTRAFAERDPEASRQIHASYARSLRWLRKSGRNIETAARWTLEAIEALTGKKPEVTAGQLERILRNDTLRFAESPVLGEGDFRKGDFLHKSFLFLQAQGKMPADARWETVERAPNRRVMREILSAPTKYGLGAYAPG
jgi:NitT/TauT family transport system substrate-binding protein